MARVKKIVNMLIKAVIVQHSHDKVLVFDQVLV